MPQIDFYILHIKHNRQEKERFVCQLTDKAWHQGYRIYIQTGFISFARHLDAMLWTFKEESFLPHDIYPDVSSSAPIRIGYTAQFCEGMDVLVNMTETVPPFFEGFKRIADIVDDTPQAKEAGRARYRFYKERGYTLKVHEINR
ncbi:DNA polymerase III subunit chi [Candidatus Parabeggiatoa sp. HSG14]|uniref:DNA polymerase III subunit chi n=1 Tax=Candidatus Parabeggiatoa sp. HSG14 TaxID=3055593 RepID=UPI0025A75608|nr:DNA polymerase III subunit chi [Thiotrichales bacterium HSG14]